MSYMKFNKTFLPNGIRLVTIPMAENPSTTVLVMVGAGSKYETKNTSGISHFLEHMVFKGTPTRPKASDISREFDAIGADHNAFTSQEMTGYYAKAASRHLDTIVDVIADMCQNPLFDEEEIRKEKGVIIEELRMYKDLPQRHVHNILNHLLYGDQPAGWDIIGTEDTINSFTRQNFLDYRNAHYVAQATTVIVSGSFDDKTIEAKIAKAFSAVPKNTKHPKLPVKESQKAPAILTEKRDTDQTHLVIACRTFSINDPRVPVMSVLSTILGGGMSSRLFQKMRNELGICYYVRTSHDTYTDHGNLTISAGVDNKRVSIAVKEILAQCELLKTKAVDAQELKKAKDYIAGSMMLELETSDQRAQYAGLEEVIKGQIESPEEFIKKVSLVTASDVQKLANEVFVNNGLNLALVGKTMVSELEPILRFA